VAGSAVVGLRKLSQTASTHCSATGSISPADSESANRTRRI
jgi:hypothetical protein